MRLSSAGLFLVCSTFGAAWAVLAGEGAGAAAAQARVPSRAEVVPPVRVLLTPSAVRSLPVQVDGPYRVVDRAGRVLGEGARLKQSQVETTSGALRFGGKSYSGGTIDLVPVKQPSLWVDGNQYRGWLRLRRSGSRVRAVNHVDLEDYLASVINSEMPDDFPAAARRAQAIAARSYVLYQMKTFGRGTDYDVTGGTRSQVYRGVQYRASDGRRLAAENASSRQVVAETRGLICTYRGRLFCTYYSAICGGRTTWGPSIFKDAAAPLVSVPCTWCRGSKYYRWESEVPRAQLEKKLAAYFREQGKAFRSLDQLQVLPPARVGQVPLVRVASAGKRTDLSAYTFRLAAGAGDVRSAYFHVEDEGPSLQFEGRGWGHGVGLCQWGARGQALAGRSTTQILQYYYRGCQLTAVR